MKNREGAFNMGLLEPYVGTYTRATSASDMLDAAAILAGCDAVDEEANHISEYAGTLSETSSLLNVQNFSVDDETILSTVDEYCQNINNVETEIMSITSQIREAVENQYNALQQQLNNEAYEKDQREYEQRSRG